MILLCSNGLTSEEIKAELRKHVKGCKSAAVVVTADNEYKENNYHVPERVEELESLGLEVGLFDIDVADAGFVVCVSGYPDYKKDRMNISGNEPIFTPGVTYKYTLAMTTISTHGRKIYAERFIVCGN